MYGIINALGQLPADTGYSGKIFYPGALQFFQATKVFEYALAAPGAHTGYSFQE